MKNKATLGVAKILTSCPPSVGGGDKRHCDDDDIWAGP